MQPPTSPLQATGKPVTTEKKKKREKGKRGVQTVACNGNFYNAYKMAISNEKKKKKGGESGKNL